MISFQFLAPYFKEIQFFGVKNDPNFAMKWLVWYSCCGLSVPGVEKSVYEIFRCASTLSILQTVVIATYRCYGAHVAWIKEKNVKN